jgi:transposase-like protein
LLDRETGKVRTSVVGTRRKGELQREIRECVAPGSEVYTDALKSYDGLDQYTHKVIDHAEAYVDGNVHTNRLENFWSLLKRAIKGTYVSVEPFHLFRYLDEQSFRYNERHATDAERFGKVLKLHRRKALDVGRTDLSGGGVMSEQSGKAQNRKNPRPKKPPGYRNFEKVLKQVIKAPSMRKHTLKGRTAQ